MNLTLYNRSRAIIKSISGQYGFLKWLAISRIGAFWCARMLRTVLRTVLLSILTGQNAQSGPSDRLIECPRAFNKSILACQNAKNGPSDRSSEHSDRSECSGRSFGPPLLNGLGHSIRGSLYIQRSSQKREKMCSWTVIISHFTIYILKVKQRCFLHKIPISPHSTF